MQLNRKLNLVVPVERDTGTMYVHSTPISREMFERYFKVIGRAYASIFAQQLGALAGPRVAAMLLKEAAVDMGVWDNEGGVERGLMAEIRRMTFIIMPKTGGGWDTITLDEAKTRNVIDEDEISEVENAVVFFILISAMSRKQNTATMLGITSAIWGAETTSLNCTEYMSSLKTSTKAETSGETATPSPIAY